MSSKENILENIRKNKPQKLGLPVLDKNDFKIEEQLSTVFSEAVKTVGGQIIELTDGQDIHSYVMSQFAKLDQRYSVFEDAGSFNTFDPQKLWYPHELEALDVLILKGEFGVAENGAIWLTEKSIPIRVMPFITKHLILVVEADKLVENMHTAYEQIATKYDEFGVFISGPSKTADIEQALVIGAQGALSLHVLLAPTS